MWPVEESLEHPEKNLWRMPGGGAPSTFRPPVSLERQFVSIDRLLIGSGWEWGEEGEGRNDVTLPWYLVRNSGLLTE